MATYVILGLVVTALIAAVIRPRSWPGRRWQLTLGLLLVLTAVFDNLIIAAGIVDYDRTKIIGLFIGVAPVEDFFYPLAAMLLVPALWHRGQR